MIKGFTVRRYNARSFQQIALDRSEESSIAEQLMGVRRVSRVIAPLLAGLPLGVDFTNLGNIRIRDNTIVLYVRSAAQSAKLRQLLPRISDALGRAGFREPVEVRIRPEHTSIDMRQNRAIGEPRTGNASAAQELRLRAQTMPDSPLKTQLLRLAATLEKSASRS